MTNQKRKRWRLVVAMTLLAAISVLTFELVLGSTLYYWAIRKVAVSKMESDLRSHDMLDEKGLRVILAGTGEPKLNKLRASPITAVIANGEFLVFDAGVGAIRQLAIQGYPISRISRIFLTHMHSDHYGGIGNIINASFIHGRRNVLEVHGPDDSYKLSHSLYPPTSMEYRVGQKDTTNGVPDQRRVNELTRKDLAHATPHPNKPGKAYIPGITHIVNAMNTLHVPDAIIRTGNKQIKHGKKDWSYNFAVPKPIPNMRTTSGPDKGWGELLTVYTSANGKLKVKAFLVDHYPCFPSYGFRVEYAGRVVVISGDTESMLTHGKPKRPSYWVKIATNADILIHEAHNFKVANVAFSALEKHDVRLHSLVQQARGAMKHHTDIIDIAKAAQEAKVPKVILTHIGLPTPFWPIQYLFQRGMKDHYDGEIVLAHDGMEVILPPK